MSSISCAEARTLPEEYATLSDDECPSRIRAAKERLGDNLLILGHHYQRDNVIEFADLTGDSLKLSRLAAAADQARYIVFCGVHFMAETADILTSARQQVILPELNAGCTMADMANEDQVEDCWEAVQEVFGGVTIPVTYVNSEAVLKAFCGRHGGTCCTSSNADKILQWAFVRGERVLFFPDENLGRNTAVKLGLRDKEMLVYNQLSRDFEWLPGQEPEDVKVILWKGFCSIHQRFHVSHIENLRKEHPGIRILVHPECMAQTVSAADLAGSTEYIIKQVEEAAAGTAWGIGTEINLVHRLAQNHPEQRILSLNPIVSPCCTMSRIAPQELTWVLERLCAGEVVNQIIVPQETKTDARLALSRMLEIG